MDTFLDLLIVVVMALAAASFLATVLMFLVKNRTFKRVCFYIVVALGVYIGTVGMRILWPGFGAQVLLAVVLGLVSIGALILERMSGESKGKFLTAQILASASLVIGMFNAFM